MKVERRERGAERPGSVTPAVISFVAAIAVIPAIPVVFLIALAGLLNDRSLSHIGEPDHGRDLGDATACLGAALTATRTTPLTRILPILFPQLVGPDPGVFVAEMGGIEGSIDGSHGHRLYRRRDHRGDSRRANDGLRLGGDCRDGG